MTEEDYDIYVEFAEDDRIPLNSKTGKCVKLKCSGCAHFWHEGTDEYNNYPSDGGENGVIWVRLKKTPEREEILQNYLRWWKEEREYLKSIDEWKVEKCTIPFHTKWDAKKINRCQYYHDHLNDRVEPTKKLSLTALESWCGFDECKLTESQRWERLGQLQTLVKMIVATKL
jgi:hypothetical protein